jgi:hypothetical protein
MAPVWTWMPYVRCGQGRTLLGQVDQVIKAVSGTAGTGYRRRLFGRHTSLLDRNRTALGDTLGGRPRPVSRPADTIHKSGDDTSSSADQVEGGSLQMALP